MKRIISLILVGVLVLSTALLAGCGKTEETEDAWSISYWIPKTDDASYYAEYEENPVVQYIAANYEFNGKKLFIDYSAAPIGSEKDDFNLLIATGEYCDVMDLSMDTTIVQDLYSQGILWDLTDLYKEHMPNYSAFLEAHPELEKEIYTIVDGQKKVLTLFTFGMKQDDPFEGFCYRRDWIARYGKNPITGEAFSYGFSDPNDYESWYDDIIFPSGNTEPVYISDWEWMFQCFTAAMADLGITDGYCYAPYYLGYLETGDISSGFGGGGMGFYTDGETIYDGYVSDNTRAYLQCMATWYENGWIDKSFTDHTNDMFYSIDTEKVYQGKVGLWQGRPSALGNQLDTGDGFTTGMMVFGCKQPINDIYGGDAQKGKEPDRYMRTTPVGSPVGLTTKLTEDELIAFMEYVDFLFTEEGSMLRNFGLNQEQYESFGSELYDRLGIKGSNYTIDENGIVHTFFPTSDLSSIAVIMGRGINLTDNTRLDLGYDVYVAKAEENWGYYPCSTAVQPYIINAVPAKDLKTVTRLKATMDQFLAKTIPMVIKGNSTYDIFDDAGWTEFVTDVQKYGSGQIVSYYQTALDLINQ